MTMGTLQLATRHHRTWKAVPGEPICSMPNASPCLRRSHLLRRHHGITSIMVAFCNRFCLLGGTSPLRLPSFVYSRTTLENVKERVGLFAHITSKVLVVLENCAGMSIHYCH